VTVLDPKKVNPGDATMIVEMLQAASIAVRDAADALRFAGARFESLALLEGMAKDIGDLAATVYVDHGGHPAETPLAETCVACGGDLLPLRQLDHGVYMACALCGIETARGRAV
jgi:hypothetical protein